MNNLNILTLDSREVAKMIAKNHAHVLRDLEVYCKYFTESNFGFSDFWELSSYQDVTGRTLKCYQITKKGCEFLAHKMTGKKGALFTASYINRFHEMEEELRLGEISSGTAARYTMWQGVKCMRLTEFADMFGLTPYKSRYHLNNKQIPHIMLTDSDLAKYKTENNLSDKRFSCVTLLPMPSVISLLTASMGKVTDDANQKLLDYFEENAAVVPVEEDPRQDEVISLRTDKVLKKVERIRDKLNALSVMTAALVECRRTADEHRKFLDVANELGMSAISDLYDLKSMVTN